MPELLTRLPLKFGNYFEPFVARGEGWLTDQAILNRDRGCVAIMNTVQSVLSTDLKDQLLPKTSLDWNHVIDIVSRERF